MNLNALLQYRDSFTGHNKTDEQVEAPSSHEAATISEEIAAEVAALREQERSASNGCRIINLV